MNVHRLQREIVALREKYPVWVSSDWTIVIVELPYPSGWTVQTGLLRYEIPADYGASAPTVHVPAKMRRYDGTHTLRLLQSPIPGWKKWCVRFGWDPRCHTLVTSTRAMMGSLSDPTKKRLFLE